MAVIKSISYFLAASILSKPLGFLLTIVLAKSLGPVEFGVWITLMLVISYSPIVCLGTVETLVKQVSYFAGRNEPERIQQVESTVMGSVCIAASFLMGLAIITLISSYFIPLAVDAFLIVMMFVAAAASFFSAYFYNRYAAHQNFKAVGATDFLRAALALLFIGGMSWRWGITGAAAGYLLHEVTVCLMSSFFSLRYHGKVGVSCKREPLLQAVRVGFPITSLWWVLTLSGTIDRVVLGTLLGSLAVGHYGLGISLASVLGLVPLAVGRVLYPKVNMEFGKNLGIESMRSIVVGPSLALAVLITNLQLILLFATPLIYGSFLPKYQPGLLAGQILLLGSFGLLRNGANYLIAANRERAFFKYILATLLFNIACDVLMVKLGMDIEGVALGSSLSGLLLTSVVWRKVLVGLGYKGPQVWATLSSLYLPLGVLATLMVSLFLIHRSPFLIFHGASILLGLGMLFLLNGVLYCFPIYRQAMHSWLQSLLDLKRVLHQYKAVRQASK